MENQLIPSVNAPPEKDEPAWWFAFIGNAMIVMEEGETTAVPLIKDITELGLQPVREWYLGTLDGHHCYCAEISENMSIPEGMVSRGLRYLYGHIEEPFHKIAMRASHMIDWDRTYMYCNRCGTEMVRAKGMNAKECPGCGFLSFPRISPAVIVLMKRDDHCFLPV